MKYGALLLAGMLLTACSLRAGWEGVQAGARQQCQSTPDNAEARRCTEEVNRRRYEDYERERGK